ncbi:MAG: isoprenylcysteine carboxylmethyltransferase family protein [Eubacteriales bacterium]|nr:isoprenylcysteine carboxylmethyltransferase family protein [Eubacteriales bacterium]
MDKKLFAQAIAKFLFGFVLVGLLIFVPAGSLEYWNGRLLMAILFIPMFIGGIVLMATNPDLLRKRLNAKEKESEQKSVVLFSGIMFICGFLLAGFNYRFGWITMPKWMAIAAGVVFLFAYAMYAEVLRENAYLSRTIEVQENQRVIDTGLYGVVRHPMYSATVFLFLSMPLVLGSLLSFVVFLAYPFILAKRIKNEEQVLERELGGYSDYKNKVKYKMLPFIW